MVMRFGDVSGAFASPRHIHKLKTFEQQQPLTCTFLSKEKARSTYRRVEHAMDLVHPGKIQIHEHHPTHCVQRLARLGRSTTIAT